MNELRKFLSEYSTSKGWGDDESDLVEVMVECGKTVWRDPDTDRHRWYICQDVVVDIDGTFIKYTDYIITGDSSMYDMDLSYSLDSSCIVTKKTRTVTETYYD